MKKNDGRLVGILGTVIIHLIAAIIFMTFKVSRLQKINAEMFTVEFQPVEETAIEKQIVLPPASSVEKILQGDNEMLNIARNLASRSDPTVNPEDYIDMVKEEMIKNGQLSRDNYIDEAKKQAESKEDENLAMEEKMDETKENKPTESQKMAANYKGPTRIYYDLTGRNHTYLPLPIYLCEGSGKVVLKIEVTQKGVVERAEVIGSESTTSDPCLLETAVNTALLSRFNPDLNAPKSQAGTLSYHFVAQ